MDTCEVTKIMPFFFSLSLSFFPCNDGVVVVMIMRTDVDDNDNVYLFFLYTFYVSEDVA